MEEALRQVEAKKAGLDREHTELEATKVRDSFCTSQYVHCMSEI